MSSIYDLRKACETRSVISQQFLYHTFENLCVDLRICWHFATCQNKNNNSEFLHSSCCMSLAEKALDCLGDLRNKLTQINQTFFYAGLWHPATTFAILIGWYPNLKDQNWWKRGLRTEIKKKTIKIAQRTYATIWKCKHRI